MIHQLSDEAGRIRRATADVREELAKTVRRIIGWRNECTSPVQNLLFFRRDAPTAPCPYLYEPSLAVILSGRKRVVLGETTYIYDESHFLLTSTNLPTVTEVLDASLDKQYISLLLKLDLELARQFVADIDLKENAHSKKDSAAMCTGLATLELLDAFKRLFALFDRPNEQVVLGGLIQREILYRILTSSAGAKLREIISSGTHASRTTRAVNWLRDNYRRSFKVEELARIAGMGVSTLHTNFRAMTAMSPLQYQKQLRLLEARRLLLAEGIDSTTAASRVGYESVTQFSREYRRQFGAPPMQDVKAIRLQVTGGGKLTA